MKFTGLHELITCKLKFQLIFSDIFIRTLFQSPWDASLKEKFAMEAGLHQSRGRREMDRLSKYKRARKPRKIQGGMNNEN